MLRVSTNLQDLRRQKADIIKLQREHDMDIIGTPLELVGVSGTAVLDNAQVQEVLKDLARPGVDGVAISAIDRLFRPKNFKDFSLLQHFSDNKKLIYSTREGRVDPSTDEGFEVAMTAAVRAGMEWRVLRQRTRDGKRECKLAGMNPNGDAGLPRGVKYKTVFDENGEKVGQWSCDGIDSERMKEAFGLILRGYSNGATAAKIGGGWTGSGLRRALKNPIWIGIRRYPDGDVPINFPPLVDRETWDRVQVILNTRTEKRGKSRKPARFLASGLVWCACGKRMYLRAGSPGHGADVYICSSRFPKGKGCGRGFVYRELLDRALEVLVTDELLDHDFLSLAIHSVIADQMAETTTEDERERLRAALDDLKGQRERVIAMFVKREITDQEKSAWLAKILYERQTLEEKLANAEPLPQIDVEGIAAAIVHAFAEFHCLSFADKRALLLEAVGRIIIDGTAMHSLAITDGFLGSAVKTLPPLIWRR